MAGRGLFSRREFLKASGAGAAAVLAAWSGARLAGGRQVGGEWTPTTCPACSAGCGLLARLRGGGALELAANPAHPRPYRADCPASRGDTGTGASGPRWPGAMHQARRGSGDTTRMDWDAAVALLAATLRGYRPDQVAFLAGGFPDHLFDLLQVFRQSYAGMRLLRLERTALQDGRVTLLDAAQACFGAARRPCFDLARAGQAVLFGAEMDEPWLMGYPADGLHSVLLSPRRAAGAQEWVAAPPGSLARLAQALGCVLEAKLGRAPSTALAGAQVDSAGLSLEKLEQLAQRMLSNRHTVAVPGALALGQADGLAAACAVLRLNVLLDNLGKPGGVYLPVDAPVLPGLSRPSSSLAELEALVERMRSGQVKVLLVHGADPLSVLPPALGFAQALEQVERVISFAPRPDATTALADYILPERLPLESWGYHKPAGTDRPLVSALQPALAPGGQGRATAEVLLAAARLAGKALPYASELDFIQAALAPLARLEGISPEAFWVRWQQRGGWWADAPVWMPAVAIPGRPAAPASASLGAAELGLVLAPGASADPAGPIWVGLHPATAHRLGLRRARWVRVQSAQGMVEARLQLDSNLHPQSAALPVEAGLALLGALQNSSGDLAASAGRVWIEA